MFETVTLRCAQAEASVSLYGAQVLSYVPTGQPDVLWQTAPDMLNTAHAATKPLRAGVPLCWPWFRHHHPTQVEAPSHGVGRLRVWEVLEHRNAPESALLRLGLKLEPEALIAQPLLGEVTVTLGDSLVVQLATTNLGTVPLPLSQALHTYLRVGDVRQATVVGLEGLPRLHISPNTPLPPHTGALKFESEVELLYNEISGPIVLNDPALNRRIEVRNSSREAAIWNPAEKAQGMDIPPEGERNFVCIEAAEVNTATVLAPGATHVLSTQIKVLP